MLRGVSQQMLQSVYEGTTLQHRDVLLLLPSTTRDHGPRTRHHLQVDGLERTARRVKTRVSRGGLRVELLHHLLAWLMRIGRLALAKAPTLPNPTQARHRARVHVLFQDSSAPLRGVSAPHARQPSGPHIGGR